jgi:Tfp pilus assembly protein PilF
VYVRGEAYLAANQPAQAAAEFQKIIDHRGIVLADPMDAMARLQLARALARSGETAKANGRYREFLELWSNADADVPLRAKVERELALLPGQYQ